MKFTRRNYFFVIILIILTLIYFPLLSRQLPPVIGSPYLWSAIWGASLIIFYPQILTHRLMILFLTYALLIFIANFAFWPNMDMWNKNNLSKEILFISMGLSIYLYFYFTGEFRDFARIIQIILIFLFITAIMTIIVTSIDPLYSRIAFDRESESEALAHKSLQSLGAGGYGFAIVFMTLFPMLIFYFKNRSLRFFNKWFITLYLIVLFFALIRMQIFGNIIVSTVGILITLAGVSKIRRSVLILALLFVVIISIPKSFYSKTLFSIADNIDKQEDLNYKLKDMAYFLETGHGIDEQGTVAAGRMARYPALIESFIQSPLFGCYFLSEKDGRGYDNSGAHLFWMNKLTVTGLAGFSFLVYFLYIFFRKSYEIIPLNMRFYYIIAILSFIAYGFFKNLGGHTWYAFFVIIPGMCYLPLLSRKHKVNNESNETLTSQEQSDVRIQG